MKETVTPASGSRDCSRRARFAERPFRPRPDFESARFRMIACAAIRSLGGLATPRFFRAMICLLVTDFTLLSLKGL